jgi:ADP-ribose pyrophosphatase
MVIPLIDNNNIAMVREFRAVIGKWILVIPAGTMEKGETSTGAANKRVAGRDGV